VKLHVLKPSVNNMAVRIFVRAANLEFTEDDVYGKTRTAEFLAMNPAHLTPMLEAKELPKGAMWESCAIMQYLCNKHEMTKFYPKSAEQRATIDSAGASRMSSVSGLNASPSSPPTIAKFPSHFSGPFHNRTEYGICGSFGNPPYNSGFFASCST